MFLDEARGVEENGFDVDLCPRCGEWRELTKGTRMMRPWVDPYICDRCADEEDSGELIPMNLWPIRRK